MPNPGDVVTFECPACCGGAGTCCTPGPTALGDPTGNDIFNTAPGDVTPCSTDPRRVQTINVDIILSGGTLSFALTIPVPWAFCNVWTVQYCTNLGFPGRVTAVLQLNVWSVSYECKLNAICEGSRRYMTGSAASTGSGTSVAISGTADGISNCEAGGTAIITW
jgi:hypothetical protein